MFRLFLMLILISPYAFTRAPEIAQPANEVIEAPAYKGQPCPQPPKKCRTCKRVECAE